MKSRPHIYLLVLAVFACTRGEADTPFPYRAIVLAPNSGIIEQTAAADLQQFVHRQFDMVLPIYTAGEISLDRSAQRGFEGKLFSAFMPEEPAAGKTPSIRFVLASEQPAPSASGESFELALDGEDLVIRGSEPRGVLQGVFWLEDVLAHSGLDVLAELPQRNVARFAFRCAMPYFTEAGTVTDDYLRSMAHAGYNAIYLAFHPFKKYISDPVFFPISQMMTIHCYTGGEDKEQLAAYVNDVFSRSSRYGLDGYLYVMEPWGGDKEFVSAHPEALGRTSEQKLAPPLCMRSEPAVEYLKNLTAELARGMPRLKGLIVMSEDGTTLCDDTCSRCKGQSRADLRARLFETLAAGGKSVRQDFQIIAYTWWWDEEDFPETIRRLPQDSLVCTRLVTHAPFELDADWAGTPGDVSLLVDGPGADFRIALENGAARGIGVVDMLPISNGHELITLPYMPAPDRYAHKLDVLEKAGGAGWIGYDCGGFTESVPSQIIREALWSDGRSAKDKIMEVAERVYGREGAPMAVEGWQACSDALQWFPVEIDKTKTTGHRQGPSMAANAPLMPLTVAGAALYNEPGPLAGWRGFRDDQAIIQKFFPKICEGLRKGIALMDEAAQRAPLDKKAAATEDVQVARAALLCFQSSLNLLDFWEQLAALTAPSATPESKEQAISRITDVVEREIQNTQQMLEIVSSDPRLFYCACTKYFHPLYIDASLYRSGYYTDDMTPAEMLAKKLDQMQKEDFTEEIKRMLQARGAH